MEQIKRPVYSFGERGNDKWFAHKDGIRIPCDEYIIDYLWWQWVISPTAERADDNKYTIFTVKDDGISLPSNN